MSDANTLLKKFWALPEDEKLILMALAILFDAINQSEFSSMLLRAKVDSKIAQKIAKPLRDKLSKEQLITRNGSKWQCADVLSEPLLRVAFKQHSIFLKI